MASITRGVYYAVMPCGAARLVVGNYRALWCRECWRFHDVTGCEVRPV